MSTIELKKAQIQIMEGKDKDTTIDVLFNPTEYKIDQKLSLHQKGAKNKSAQFTSGEPATLSLSLFFDTGGKITGNGDTEPSDVTKETDKFIKLLYIDATIHKPPKIKFMWGSLKFIGAVSNINSNFIMFDKNGMPLRAKLSITIEEVLDSQEDRKTPFESPDRTKCRMITQDNTIWNIAYHEYDSMENWRMIASANGIMNPLEIENGQILKVPAIT